METRVLKVITESQLADAAKEAADALLSGKLVGFPTETVYGVAAVATNAAAMERLRDLKDRPSRPFTVHIASPKDVARYIKDVPAEAKHLIRKGWPGPITVLLPTGGKLADADIQQTGAYDVLCDGGVIGLRCPDESLAQAMLAGVDQPVVAPSANLAGQGSPRNARDVLEFLGGKIDLLLDGGQTRYGKDSTIVRFDEVGWQIIRKGVLEEREIKKLVQTRWLFVCTGNTCRSPIAAGIAKHLLAKRLGCEVAGLKKKGYEIISAGVYAGEGHHATPEAIHAASEFGADISRHATRKVTTELINSADLVFCMTDYHVDEVTRAVPGAAYKVRKLAQHDIADPIGGGFDAYKQTAKKIHQALQAVISKVEL
jgi:tRNA threonylcarbamoyl adenosine modification protein (Sua5/YciO/YrdC/YwlC family)